MSDPVIRPAGRAVRCVAALLDLAVLLSPALPLAAVAVVFDVPAVVYQVLPVAFVAVGIWLLVWQSFSGSSFGKSVLGLRLVRAVDYQPPGLSATLVRTFVFFATVGLAALPVLFAHPGLHDRAARLTVLDVANAADPLGPHRGRNPLRR